MKQIKSFPALMLSLVMLFSITACGKTPAVTEPTTAAAATTAATTETTAAPTTTAPTTTTTEATTAAPQFPLTGTTMTTVSLTLNDSRDYNDFGEYFEAVKLEIEQKNPIKDIVIFIRDYTGISISKTEWDGFFQYFADNGHPIESIRFDRVDMSRITGIGVLAEIPSFKSFRVEDNFETELSEEFPAMPGITTLEVKNLTPDLLKRFPNVKNIKYAESTSGIEMEILKNCKDIVTINGKPATSKEYEDAYVALLKEEMPGFKSASGKGSIDGTFTLTYTNNEETIDGYLSDLLSAYDGYTTSLRQSDYYVLLTGENERKDGTYMNNITVGYKRDFYIQIFDIKNKLKHEKTYIISVGSPYTLSYRGDPPEKAYSPPPQDDIARFITEVTGVTENYLSGRYELSDSSAAGPVPFERTDYLIFDGTKVKYGLGETSNSHDEYGIIGDRLFVYYGNSFIYDFDIRIDGNTIYIDNSVWEKAS
jgi:hypothetical protein